jgi:adenosylcobinamide amidohydrolase
VTEGLPPFSSLSITENPDILVMKTSELYYTDSCGVLGDGVKWANTFYNRYVDKHYGCDGPKQKNTEFSKK